jgi:F0F1-type ATP synthase membrane subunit b/b'
MKNVTSSIENLELEAEKSLEEARAKAADIITQSNVESQKTLAAPLPLDEVNSQSGEIVEQARREAEKRVDESKKQADELKSGALKKVDETVDRMMKLVTGA